MFALYRIVVGLLFYFSLPILLLLVALSGRHRQGLLQRFGFYPKHVKDQRKRIWLHAASVGEVQAARSVIQELQKRLPTAVFTLTTMTVHGKRVAEDQLDGKISCYLAPLDVPWVVERSIERIRPDIYICIETELWPLLLYALSRANTLTCLLNGRISERTYGSYLKIQWFIKGVVGLFDRIAVISERDKEKYISLGADRSKIIAEGNVKYDIAFSGTRDAIKDHYRNLLAIDGEEVFIAGSTHTGEEELLLRLYRDSFAKQPTLFIIAPRHIERIIDLESICISEGFNYQLFSDLKEGTSRKEALILVDTMGELAQLYSVGDFIFCGGSLVDRGGHNLMEAAIWQRAVFSGPSNEDFQDSADLLQAAQGGFIVRDITDLGNQIRYFRNHPNEYHAACRRAGESAMKQQGCAERQVRYILDGYL